MSERKRESNFTNAEIDLLLHLCNTNKKILENKTTNAVTWKQKLLAWEKIHTEFNSTTDGQSRSIKNLRSKYDSMKKEVRKSVAKQKKDVTGTGGGPFINLKSTFADEFDFGITMEEIDNTSMLEENNSPINPTDTIRVDFSDYSASMLQTAKPKELKRKISTDIVVDQVPTTSDSLFEKLVERELKILGKKEQEDTIEHQLRTTKLKLEIEKLELEILLLKKSTQS
ncbi:hypothetical protein ACI65C_006609 [Semiaphis heraclei]